MEWNCYQDDDIIAFDDIHPRAPQHKIIIPKKHFATLNDLGFSDENKDLIANLFFVGKNLARDLNIEKTGYRLLFNCNHDSGQEVFHIHLHLLGGKILGPIA